MDQGLSDCSQILISPTKSSGLRAAPPEPLGHPLYAQLAEQARGREHDPDDERGQAGKQQNFTQDSSHANLPYALIVSPMRGSSWHIRGLAVGPLPDSGT